jgi:hypothetical protein
LLGEERRFFLEFWNPSRQAIPRSKKPLHCHPELHKWPGIAGIFLWRICQKGANSRLRSKFQKTTTRVAVTFDLGACHLGKKPVIFAKMTKVTSGVGGFFCQRAAGLSRGEAARAAGLTEGAHSYDRADAADQRLFQDAKDQQS